MTTDIWDDSVVDALLRRPFFLLISVDAPVSVRWQRFRDRCATNKLTPPTLEDFVLRNDAHLFAPHTGLSAVFQRAQLKLLNSTTSVAALRDAVRSLNLTNEARLRPSWDQYFMQLADLAALRSNCMKRRVGCVVVREKRVISTGYNGTPRGMTNCNEGGCKYTLPVLANNTEPTRSTLQQRSQRRRRPLHLPVPARRGKRPARGRPRSHRRDRNAILQHLPVPDLQRQDHPGRHQRGRLQPGLPRG